MIEFIAQYLGDGILVYFGFPLAQEHAAERAVRAGLEIVDKVARLRQRDGQPLQTRVGIATGVVVAGEASGVGPAGEETVVGDTPNLAARLQSHAEPGCVLVSSSTHRITADFFEYSLLGALPVKGFREPIPVWKALRESATESRFRPRMQPRPGQSSAANANWHFFTTRGNARPVATGMWCCWLAKQAWASRACWRHLLSAFKNRTACCAVSVHPITAIASCSVQATIAPSDRHKP